MPSSQTMSKNVGWELAPGLLFISLEEFDKCILVTNITDLKIFQSVDAIIFWNHYRHCKYSKVSNTIHKPSLEISEKIRVVVLFPVSCCRL